MKITLIGAGNLATNLGKALAAGGHEIVQVYSRTMDSASRLAAVTGGKVINRFCDITDTAEVYVFSVKDSALPDVARGVSRQVDAGKVFLHTAGSIPMECFRGLADHYGVLYPMQTFSKTRSVDFREIPCFIESNDACADEKIRQIATSLSPRNIYELSSEKRKYLHLSAVWACNFANHCYAVAAELLDKCGIPFEAMLPLIDETARKVHELHPLEAQTGPALRYDENVMDFQKDLLADDLLLRQIYEKMSMSIYLRNKNKK